MSEEEKRKRDLYKKRRDFRIRVQACLIAFLTVVSIVFAFAFYQANKTYYISYTEKGDIDYKVYLLENDFFEEEFLGEGQAYVASLIDKVRAEFFYELEMDTANVDYEYSYKVDSKIEIMDENTGAALYAPTYNLVPEESFSKNSSSKLVIAETLDIDYGYYNNIAKSFINEYSLGSTKSTLIVTMYIDVTSISDDFESDSKNQYVVSLNIPLAAKTLNVEMSSSIPDSESKILACDRVLVKNIFKFGTICFASLDILFVAVFIFFIYFTRNKDINYTIKVQKLFNSYRSFIQKINNEFDTLGYQQLMVNSFNEMLDIRDTLQSPILMSENDDKTCTKFVIPTNTKLLYVFEIKVEGYDEIYGIDTIKLDSVEIDAPAKEPILPEEEEQTEIAAFKTLDDSDSDLETAPVLAEAKEEAAKSESVDETVASSESEYIPAIQDEDISLESEAFAFGVKCDYSFEAKLILASDETKDFYQRIVCFARSYGVKVTRSWKKERIHLGRNLFATLIFKGTKLAVAFALDPKEYVDTKYRVQDLSGVKKYEKTPMLMKINVPRRVGYAIELLEVLFKNAGLENKALQVEPEIIPKKSKLTLVSENLIRFEGSEENVKAAVAKIWENHDKRTVLKAEEPVVAEEAISEEEPSYDATEEISEDDDAQKPDHYISGTKYDYSFEAKLALATEETKGFYNEISSFVKSYGVKLSGSWKRERIHLSKQQFGMLMFKGLKLCVALALDPSEYMDTKYRPEDLSGVKKYEKTPMLIKINTPRKVKYAIELLEKTFKDAGLENKQLEVKTKKIISKSKQSLIKAGLIRKK